MKKLIMVMMMCFSLMVMADVLEDEIKYQQSILKTAIENYEVTNDTEVKILQTMKGMYNSKEEFISNHITIMKGDDMADIKIEKYYAKELIAVGYEIFDILKIEYERYTITE